MDDNNWELFLPKMARGPETFRMASCTTYLFIWIFPQTDPPPLLYNTLRAILRCFTEWEIIFSNSLWTECRSCSWFWTAIKLRAVAIHSARLVCPPFTLYPVLLCSRPTLSTAVFCHVTGRIWVLCASVLFDFGGVKLFVHDDLQKLI